jgi:hypothetical protein
MGTKVSIDAERFRSGNLPRICARTGEPTSTGYRTLARSRTSLGWLLLPLFPFWTLVLARSARVFYGYVPLTAASVKRRRVLRVASLACVALALAGVAAGIGSGDIRYAEAGGVFFAAYAVLYLVREVGDVDVWPDRETDTVVFDGVHPNFVAALRSAPPAGA